MKGQNEPTTERFRAIFYIGIALPKKRNSSFNVVIDVAFISHTVVNLCCLLKYHSDYTIYLIFPGMCLIKGLVHT